MRHRGAVRSLRGALLSIWGAVIGKRGADG
ncbi:hypothetical protein QOZ98_001748 [Planomicrobium stackebrandtii]|uniref:Uncharacterized protein n=1 Tax=Planomicrobium stackebrandtii TaxID=253160 RepID=A0ABU0GU93_9BACL|nr:hypothetical protein [Planomicrobium stackebrandtii]